MTRASMGPLLAGTLGVAAVGSGEVALGAPPAAANLRHEIVVTAGGHRMRRRPNRW